MLREDQRPDGLLKLKRKFSYAIGAILPALLPLLYYNAITQMPGGHANKTGEIATEPRNKPATHAIRTFVAAHVFDDCLLQALVETEPGITQQATLDQGLARQPAKRDALHRYFYGSTIHRSPS